MQNYHKHLKDKKYAIKIDLAKAYDFLHWDFLKVILATITLLPWFIGWIMNYVYNLSFLVNINREFVGFFSKVTKVLDKVIYYPLIYLS